MNLERLLTLPEGFGLVDASPVQRAVCRMMTGEPLEELATVPDVAAIVGGERALAQLPTKPPRVVCLGAAVRCGKSTIVAAKAVRNAYLGDCSGLAPGEVPRVNIVSVDLDKSRETFSKILGACLSSPTLSSLVIGTPKNDSIVLRNQSGWPVEIKMIAGSRAGQTLVSRWCLGAIFDEAPRMVGQEDGVVNLSDALTALHARMRPGAQIDLVGSLWAPRGPVFELVQSRFGKPGEDCLVIIASGPQLRPELYTPEYCEEIRRADDRTYESDVMSRFADPEDALLSSLDVGAAFRSTDTIPQRVHGQNYVAIMDPATRGNGWTLVVLTAPTAGSYEVVIAREWLGSRAKPLRAATVLGEMAEMLGWFELSEVHTDQWGFDLLQDIAELAETGLVFIPLERDDTVTAKMLETLLGARKLSLPANPVLRRDLIALRKRPKQAGGSAIVFPLTADGRHCDYGAAVLLGMMVLPDAPGVAKQQDTDDVERRVLEMLGARNEHPMDFAAEHIAAGSIFQ